jgi:hypothetical protein
MTTRIAVADETLEFAVDGRAVRVTTRLADGDGLGRLFELSPSPIWDDASPMTDEDVATVVRGLIDRAGKKGQLAEVVGVPPSAAVSFPSDAPVYVSPVEPTSFSLPCSPNGLALEMDEHGNGHLWAIGKRRVELGSDGMWWIVKSLIDALVDPVTTSMWPRFLTLGTYMSGPASQASLVCGEWGVGIVWRKLDNGIVGGIVGAQEISHERIEGWLSLLRPVLADLEQRRVHRQRLRPARMADKWARAIEKWSETPRN